MNEKYLNLFKYPLKLENVIDKIQYKKFCKDNSGGISSLMHKKLLLYLICTGYPFENILLEQRADLRSSYKVNYICPKGEFRYFQIQNHEVFKKMDKLGCTNHFIENDPLKCFVIQEECINHIYDIAKQTLYNISKEILYKHFLLFYPNILTFDIVSYIMNISLDLLI